MIIISPYSSVLPNGENPKNYPYWKEVIADLQKDFHIVQVGHIGERELTDDVKFNLELFELENLLKESQTFISVDNFFHHLAHRIGVRGVVIWGQSNPSIFGYPEHTNLVKSDKYFRANQFGKWTDCIYDAAAFVEPEAVIEAVRGIIVLSQ